jgi:hypothetical protein
MSVVVTIDQVIPVIPVIPSDVDYIKILENKLNKDLGFHWWKKYVASAFWCNVSTPINLAITVFTALTTGQATTDNLLPRGAFISISIAALILTTLNTFFRPHAQMILNMKLLDSWAEFGNRFETIYYMPYALPEDNNRRLQLYRVLYEDVQRFKNTDSPENANFVTDLLYTIVRMCCMRHRNKWLDSD